jgi:hypothetical protein
MTRPHRLLPALAVSLIVAASAAASAGDARYAGHTDQRPGRHGPQRLATNHVSFRVARGRVRSLTIPWLATCVDGFQGRPSAPLIDTAAFDPIRLRGGRFVLRGAGYRMRPGRGQVASVSMTLKGVLAGRRAWGTLRVRASIQTDGVYTSDYCATRRPIRWHARLRR